MHCIDDKPNGLILNHDSDWSGEVRIAWYVVAERHDPSPTLFRVPPSLQECWCAGVDLVAGRFTPVSTTREPAPGCVIVPEPPVHVLTRAVALAVESYLTHKITLAVSELRVIDDQHADACDALGDAEHELLICAAVVGGWKREDAEQSV